MRMQTMRGRGKVLLRGEFFLIGEFLLPPELLPAARGEGGDGGEAVRGIWHTAGMRLYTARDQYSVYWGGNCALLSEILYIFSSPFAIFIPFYLFTFLLYFLIKI